MKYTILTISITILIICILFGPRVIRENFELDDFALFKTQTFNDNPVVGYHPKYDQWLPTVDGVPNSQKSLFMFAYNKCKPECCVDSAYSCSGGCVCLTEDQKKHMGSRGGNSHYSRENCTKLGTPDADY